MKYWVRILDETIEVEVRRDGAVLLEGQVVDSAVFRQGGPAVSLMLDGERHRLSMTRDDEKWTVTHGGETVPVVVETERSRRIEEARAKGIKGKGSGAVRAPMPGLVLRIDVREGDSVESAAGLVVLEAMKMENLIRAPVSGTVSKVGVTPGQAVEKGALLVEISADPS